MNGTIRAGVVCVLLAAVSAAASCVETPRRGEVQREWSLMMREYGILPVFPPREDLQVGDVYLRRDDPENIQQTRDDFTPIDLWVASLQPASVETQYGRRGSFPDSIEQGVTNDQGQTLPGRFVRVPAQGDPDHNAFTHRDMTRLRQVAFPDFLSMTVRSGDVRALIPVQGLSLAFGATWQNDQQADIKIPAAESYGIPFTMIRPVLFRESKTSGGTQQAILSPAIAAKEDLALFYQRLHPVETRQRPRTACEKYVFLEVVTEVYYARVLDIAITRKNDFGARMRVSPAVKDTQTTTETTTGMQTESAGAISTESTHTTTVESSSAPLTGDPIERAKQMNDRLKDTDSLSKVGGTFQFISVSESSVGMRRSYQRPVAVGWRGVTLKVRVLDGAVEGVGAANSAFSTTAGKLDLQLMIQKLAAEQLASRAPVRAAGIGVEVLVTPPTEVGKPLILIVNPEDPSDASKAILVVEATALAHDPRFLRDVLAALEALAQASPPTPDAQPTFEATRHALRAMLVEAK